MMREVDIWYIFKRLHRKIFLKLCIKGLLFYVLSSLGEFFWDLLRLEESLWKKQFSALKYFPDKVASVVMKRENVMAVSVFLKLQLSMPFCMGEEVGLFIFNKTNEN